MFKVNKEAKKYIFVDYFDTVVFRCVDSHAVLNKWAEWLKKRFLISKGITTEQIVELRNKIKYDFRNEYEEVPYEIIMGALLKELIIDCKEKEFVSLNLEVEEHIEMSVQFLNIAMVQFLKAQKLEGKKIYLLTDFYLPKTSYMKFLKRLGIYELFDDIFVSEEVNATKRRRGSKLYWHALSSLNIEPKDVVMIGDNADSDVLMAEKVGIQACLYKRKNKKVININNKMFYKKFINFKARQWNATLCLEYAYMFFLFEQKLYKECITNKINVLTFLSRDGYFLKCLFDKYQELFLPNEQRIQTKYCYNSRKVNQDASGNKKVFKDYMAQFMDGEYLNIVDCGWNNSSQERMQEILGCKTRGFYIGTFSKKKLDQECIRKGLIYDIEEIGKVSDYYWLLRTNFTLIEQLLGAPHGSVVSIGEDGVETSWHPKEKDIYENKIKEIQESIAEEFIGLCLMISEDEKELKYLAKINVKRGLFGSKARLGFLTEMAEAYYDNLSDGGNSKGNSSFRKIKYSLKEKLFYPEKRLSILVKKQRRIQTKSKMARYKIWAGLFYLRLVLLGKLG